MKGRKSSRRDNKEKNSAVRVGSKAAVYGNTTSICTNAKCLMRKNAGCSGYEGCPGFKGK